MNPIEFADKHLYPYKLLTGEIQPVLCPYCHGGEKKDKYTFALSIDKLTFNCLRGKCGKKGKFYKLCKDFNETNTSYSEKPTQTKAFVKPQVTIETPQSKVKEYLQLRGISEKTWKARGVGEKDGNIVFPYYENGELVLVKYRKPEKYIGNGQKAWRETGGKAVFWGMDDCDFKKPLTITEGENDTLAILESGVTNVVSVPSGSKDLTCVTNCWKWLEKFKKIILWGDNDAPGKELVHRLIVRLGEVRCYVVESPHKDANVHLHLEGKESVAKAVKDAAEVPLKNVLRLATIESFDPNAVERIKSGLFSLDSAIDGFMMGQVSVWTGINSSGKSAFLQQMMVESVNQGYSACVYSGELIVNLLRYWMELPMAGRNNITQTAKYGETPRYTIKNDVKETIRDWYKDKLFVYDSRGVSTCTDVLGRFEETARRYNCRVFLIDNLMTIAFDGHERDYYRQQSEFIGRCVDFAHKFNVHVHLVAHPRKTEGKLTKMDVAGSGDITNRADNVFGVHRGLPGEQYASEINVFKTRFNGVQDIDLDLNFDMVSKRFFGDSDDIDKQYGWERELSKNKEEDKEVAPWEK